MPTDALQSFQSILPQLGGRAEFLDQSGDWPAEELRILNQTGAMRWGISPHFGGIGLPPLDLHLCYEQIARSCLTLALILSQRDSAAGFMEASDSPAVAALLRR